MGKRKEPRADDQSCELTFPNIRLRIEDYWYLYITTFPQKNQY